MSTTHMFDKQTTYANDYGIKPLTFERKEPICRNEPKMIKSETYLYPKHNETFIDTHMYVPFNMHWKQSKSKIGRIKQEQRYDKELEDVIRTRPRLYISPAASIDDVEDKEMRALLINYMYTTESRSAERQAITQGRPAKKVLSFKRFAEDPVALPANWEARMENWDAAQNRAAVNPNTKFWERHTSKYSSEQYSDLVTQDYKDQIAHLIEVNNLRWPHDVQVSTYTGYVPKHRHHIPLMKLKETTVQPNITTNRSVALN